MKTLSMTATSTSGARAERRNDQICHKLPPVTAASGLQETAVAIFAWQRGRFTVCLAALFDILDGDDEA